MKYMFWPHLISSLFFLIYRNIGYDDYDNDYDDTWDDEEGSTSLTPESEGLGGREPEIIKIMMHNNHHHHQHPHHHHHHHVSLSSSSSSSSSPSCIIIVVVFIAINVVYQWWNGDIGDQGGDDGRRGRWWQCYIADIVFLLGWLDEY